MAAAQITWTKEVRESLVAVDPAYNTQTENLPAPMREQSAVMLVESGRYADLAGLLHRWQIASDAQNDMARSRLISAAQQLCFTCRQYQEDAGRLQEELKTSLSRQHELEEQLIKLVTLAAVDDGESPRFQPMSDEGLWSGLIAQADLSRSLRHWWQARAGEALDGVSNRNRSGPSSRPWPVPSTVLSGVHSQVLPGRSQDTVAEPVMPSLFTTATARSSAMPENRPGLAVYCLGAFRVFQNDQLVTDWNGIKGQVILKYLVSHGRKVVAKDVLMDVLWPDVEPEAARRNLHQAIYSLRQTLRQLQPDLQAILYENDCYGLNPELALWTDFEEFEHKIALGRKLEADGRVGQAMVCYGIAEGLYGGAFLEEDLYEAWPYARREQLRNLYLVVADRLGGHHFEQGDMASAIALSQKLLQQDACHEGAHRRLIRCYMAQGQRHLAVRAFHRCVKMLKQELDLPPATETVALYRQLVDTA